MAAGTTGSTAGRFERVLQARDVVTLAFGAMIGWSWVMLSGRWVAEGGSGGAMLAFVLGGAAILLIGLLYSELVAAMPRAGGEHVYAHRALGANAAFLCSWALLMAYVTVCVFEAVALPAAVEYLWPEIRIGTLWHVGDSPVDLGFVIVGAAGAIVMTIINLFGIRIAAIAQGLVTLVIIVSGVLLVTGAISFGDPSNLEPWLPHGVTGMLTVLVMAPAMYVGFDVIPQSAEEINVPPRALGMLLFLSVLMAVLWYVAIVAAVAIGLPADARNGEPMGTALAADALWAGVGSAPWAGSLMVLGGIGGILTSWNAFLVGGSRVVYALARDGMLPASLAELHPRWRTPWRALLIIGVLSVFAPLCGRTVLVWLVDAGSFAIVIAYGMVCVAFLVLRVREPAMPRPFRVPAGRWVGSAAVLSCVALFCLYLPWSPAGLEWPAEWAIVGGMAVVGVLVWWRQRPHFTHDHAAGSVPEPMSEPTSEH
jgi:amino acid transporter